MRVHINIGSNQGDRLALVGQAVALIAEAWPQAAMYESAPVESAPWGYESDAAFINLGIMLELPGRPDPHEILHTLQAIERRIAPRASHRNPDGSYRDRPIDIDLIDAGGLRVCDAELTLPHPRAHLRPFVIGPLRELDPATADAIIRLAAR